MKKKSTSTDQTTSVDQTTEEEIPEELKGKVLVAKVGHEDQFLESMAKAHKIAHGTLGWQGMAEMMYEIGGIDLISAGEIKVDPNWTRKEHIEAIKEVLQRAHLQDIMDHAEWLTEEEADKRKKSTEVLYGHKCEEPDDK